MSHLSNSFGAFLLLTVMGGGLAPEVLASSVRPTMTITQQQDALQGVVTDANGEPVMGAAVRVKNSGRVSVTKDDGSFSIPGVKKGSVIVISFLGYDTQEVTWNGGPLKVTLQEKDNTLGEAVVVGFGTQKRVNMTGSISTVSAKEIQARPVNSTVEALQGVVPGMNFAVGSGGGALDSDLSFNIRGNYRFWFFRNSACPHRRYGGRHLNPQPSRHSKHLYPERCEYLFYLWFTRSRWCCSRYNEER